MSSKLSVETVLANLEQRAIFLRERESWHAQQEVHHREQRAAFAAELEKVLQSLEAFRTVSATAVELAQPIAAEPAAASMAEEDLPPPGRLMVGRLIELVVESPGLGEPFGASAVAEETNRRFASRLRKSVDSRTASDVLRRLLAAGEIERVRKGKAFYEAMYRRRKPRGR